jgi:hypothetical protein
MHLDLEGRHAFLSPSKHSWLHYDDEKLDQAYINALAAKKGTDLHELAQRLINLGVKLPRSEKTLNKYVNDMIGYRMTTEQILYYSEVCFGQADAIAFRKELLRIADLKTGVRPTSPDQLKVYAALFCLEYRIKPGMIRIELLIYQNDECRQYDADPIEIAQIMDRIITFDKRITAIREEAL